ncbi:MAG TPA: metal ABC transporter permease [Sandaracinaceae bacterium LLY-WYZ-13_1]|nr:metal ABC transporter permease [Sandaracinaceae bacterium LLY-WYZ-13_1]
MLEAFGQPFFQRILVAGVLASVTAGVVGSLVVVKRMSTVTGGLAHAAFGGVGLGYLLGFDPILGAAGFAVVSAGGIGVAYRRFRAALDTSISIVWSVGMALGILFVSLAPGYAPDLMSYLFGSILFATWDYVLQVAILDVVVLAVVGLLFDGLRAVTFDEDFAEARGLPVDALYAVLLTLIALSVVTLIRVVGVILAIALLTIPAAAARVHAHDLGSMMVRAAALSAACTIGGLLASYGLAVAFDVSIPSGALIILGAASAYGAILGSTALRRA